MGNIRECLCADGAVLYPNGNMYHVVMLQQIYTWYKISKNYTHKREQKKSAFKIYIKYICKLRVLCQCWGTRVAQLVKCLALDLG